jgi:hypothetical protein
MTPRDLGIGSAILILAGPAFAHHSFAMFDYNKDVTIVSDVKELRRGIWRAIGQSNERILSHNQLHSRHPCERVISDRRPDRRGACGSEDERAGDAAVRAFGRLSATPRMARQLAGREP